MTDNNYIVIQGWMINQLNLKGNELLCYALIYGFSQDGKSEFIGSASYIAGWLNIDKRRVFDVLKRLTEKGYIQKSEKFVANNVKLCSYKAVKNVTASDETSSPNDETSLPSDETSSNNIVNNIVNNTKQVVSNDTTTKPKSENEFFEFGIQNNKTRKPNLYEKCLAMINDYTNDSELKYLLIQYLKLTLEMKDNKLYANQWKGLLNKLSSLSSDISDQKLIVRTSIEKGWRSFYLPKKDFNNNFNNNRPVDNVVSLDDDSVNHEKAKNPDGTLRYF